MSFISTAERRNDAIISGYFCHMLWLGANQNDQRAGSTASEWISYRSKIRQQPRIE